MAGDIGAIARKGKGASFAAGSVRAASAYNRQGDRKCTRFLALTGARRGGSSTQRRRAS
jgi:hypothetical protein